MSEKMTTLVVTNDEKENIVVPLLKNDDITITESNSNNHQDELTSTNKEDQQSIEISLYDSEFKPVTISFYNINYTIGHQTVKRETFPCCRSIPRKQVLSDVSGIFTSGMNAILGMLYHSIRIDF
jgi:hypothetical protein